MLLNGDSWESTIPQQIQSPQRNASRGRHNSQRGGGGGHRHNYGGRRNGQFQREYNKFNVNNNNKREREIENDNCRESVNSIKNKTNLHDNSLAIFHIMPQVAEAEGEGDTKITISTLFDSGATSKNYISTQIAQELHEKGAKICECNKLVCSSLGNEPICKKSQGTMKCTIVYEDEHKKEYRDNIEATIIESSFDLIFGNFRKRNNERFEYC